MSHANGSEAFVSSSRASEEHLTSILKHENSPKVKMTKGLRFENSSSEDDSQKTYTRVTRRRIIKTRSRTKREIQHEKEEDSD